MSSKKIEKIIEKKQIGIYAYPKTIDKLNEISRLTGISKTEVMEAATLFFCECPQEIQEKIFRFYQQRVAQWTLENAGVEFPENILEDFFKHVEDK